MEVPGTQIVDVLGTGSSSLDHPSVARSRTASAHVYPPLDSATRGRPACRTRVQLDLARADSRHFRRLGRRGRRRALGACGAWRIARTERRARTRLPIGHREAGDVVKCVLRPARKERIIEQLPKARLDQGALDSSMNPCNMAQ
jgi:hypothetical protein